MRFNYHGINLVLNDTLRLSAIPYAANGRVIESEAATSLTITDTTVVRVASDGLLYAIRPGLVRIITELTIDTVTHQDTTRIRVMNTTEPPQITSFSLQIPTNDSATVSLGAYRQIPIKIMNGSVPADPVLVDYWTSDTSSAKILPDGILSGVRVGQTMVYASTTVAGTKWIDSVRYTVKARPQ